MTGYKPHAIEEKWRKYWREHGIHKAALEDESRDPCYCLVMYSYPSGSKLHIGHWFNFGPTDTWARFRRMQGYNIFEPMGFDSFGLPAENYAIKMKGHPRAHTEANIAYMRVQLSTIGAMYDWDHEIETHKPDYYRWTQWLFLELHRNGYAYRRNAPVNWCTDCRTVLANEQVIDGECERCESEVIQRDLTQWFFRTTAFAEELLEGLEGIDWPEKTVAMQRNWIGRSEGARIDFRVADGAAAGETLCVFTTRPDTLFGATYMVLAPEHPLVESVVSEERREAVRAYVAEAAKATEIDRASTVREKTGVFSGAHAINPANGERLPIWIADYVLASYGTGAGMAVPAHDERDFEFATKFELPIRRVILGVSADPDEPITEAYVESGPMCRAGELDGLRGDDAKRAVIKLLEADGQGEGTINYRLRDWLISRQRYWGAPIPIVHCPSCGELPVPDDELPVLLPDDVEFMPTGESPLKRHPTWKQVACPSCGGAAERDCDTMDTFVDSSWYFLRYPTPKKSDGPFDSDIVNRWEPVHQYVGGAEHAVMHLLYARFITKVLHKLGHIGFDEPFSRLVHQGTITNGGAKMSKSRGNVVTPEDYIDRYGSDTLRAYLMFGFAYIEGGDWDDSGIYAMFRYLSRVHRFMTEQAGAIADAREREDAGGGPWEELRFVLNNSIKGATQDIERFQFNTAISRHMELTNALYAFELETKKGDWGREVHATVEAWVKIIAPIAPHLGEELWRMMRSEGTVFDTPWPQWDESALVRDMLVYPIQVNGKLRDKIEVARGTGRDEVGALAMAHGRVPDWIEGKTVRKVIVIPEKLVNIVVS
ncbi:MAG: leucine--tRNA ligase [Gemmatimonadetes bacterium]|nr:leucine--tRNA ligase [Gemmatimonadota bacterium]